MWRQERLNSELGKYLRSAWAENPRDEDYIDRLIVIAKEAGPECMATLSDSIPSDRIARVTKDDRKPADVVVVAGDEVDTKDMALLPEHCIAWKWDYYDQLLSLDDDRLLGHFYQGLAILAGTGAVIAQLPLMKSYAGRLLESGRIFMASDSKDRVVWVDVGETSLTRIHEITVSKGVSRLVGHGSGMIALGVGGHIHRLGPTGESWKIRSGDDCVLCPVASAEPRHVYY